MDAKTSVLLWTAVTVAFGHTAIGVDHYLPFVVLSRAQGWTWRKLMVITGLCGLGHVLSSVVLAFLAIVLGAALFGPVLETVDSARGTLASCLLIAFGLAYAVWGVYRSLRGRPHTHAHFHEDMTFHTHEHNHEADHVHAHVEGRSFLTVWTMFIIFIFGPCESMIPLLMAPAMEGHWEAVTLIAVFFSVVTVGTMLGIVTLGYLGLRVTKSDFLERHVHTAAGLAIAASGFAVLVLPI